MKPKEGVPKGNLQLPGRAFARGELHKKVFVEVSREHPEWALEKRALETARRVNEATKRNI